jgi:hypothetical protein
MEPEKKCEKRLGIGCFGAFFEGVLMRFGMAGRDGRG